jgi:hypothetical protein
LASALVSGPTFAANRLERLARDWARYAKNQMMGKTGIWRAWRRWWRW